MRQLRLFALCLGIAACVMCRVHICLAEQPVPALTARVMDLTGTLTASQRSALEAKLAAFEQEKGAQIAVLIVPTTQPETIEQYSIRVVDVWKLGRKGVDDGVLFLIAKDDRKMRIEVGYGLEGALSDAVSKRIISEIITPFFKQGDFYGGIDAGLNAIFKVVSGEPLPAPSLKAKRRSSSGSGVLPMLFMAVFFSAILGSVFLRMIFGRFLGGIFTFLAAAFLTWFILSSIVWAVILGIIALFMGMAMRGSGTSGFYGGGFGGGGSFGDGGGFSGGGGGFGGGGSSGDW